MLTIRNSYLCILKKIVLVNNKIQKLPYSYIFLGDLIFLMHKPINFLFFFYNNLNKVLSFYQNYRKNLVNFLALINYTFVLILKGLHIFYPIKYKPFPYGFYFNFFFFKKKLIQLLLFIILFNKNILKLKKRKKQVSYKKYLFLKKKDYLYSIIKFIEIYKYSIIKENKI